MLERLRFHALFAAMLIAAGATGTAGCSQSAPPLRLASFAPSSASATSEAPHLADATGTTSSGGAADSSALTLMPLSFSASTPPGGGTPAPSGGAQGSRAWRFGIEGTYLYGNVHGSLQTPAGGNPGTTSSKRPTFGEIGIHQLNIADVSGVIGTGPHELYGGAQFIRPSGDATLGSALVTNGVTFPAGTRVHSDVNLDWYRFGYRYDWVIDRGSGERPEWTIYPSAGGAIFTFDYRLTGGGQRASRSYAKALPQLGLAVDWRPRGGPLALSAGAMGFPQISSIPAILVEQASARYRLLRRDGFALEGFVGVQWEQIYYEDSQRVPNRIHADLGPLLQVGLTAGF
jgi:hypothetical protein